MSEPLKPRPCPFCGSNNIYYQDFCDGIDHAIACEKCYGGWGMGNFNSRRLATEAWNRRATDPELEAVKQFLRWLSKDSETYPGTDAGIAAGRLLRDLEGR